MIISSNRNRSLYYLSRAHVLASCSEVLSTLLEKQKALFVHLITKSLKFFTLPHSFIRNVNLILKYAKQNKHVVPDFLTSATKQGQLRKEERMLLQ